MTCVNLINTVVASVYVSAYMRLWTNAVLMRWRAKTDHSTHTGWTIKATPGLMKSTSSCSRAHQRLAYTPVRATATALAIFLFLSGTRTIDHRARSRSGLTRCSAWRGAWQPLRLIYRTHLWTVELIEVLSLCVTGWVCATDVAWCRDSRVEYIKPDVTGDRQPFYDDVSYTGPSCFTPGIGFFTL